MFAFAPIWDGETIWQSGMAPVGATALTGVDPGQCPWDRKQQSLRDVAAGMRPAEQCQVLPCRRKLRGQLGGLAGLGDVTSVPAP